MLVFNWPKKVAEENWTERGEERKYRWHWVMIDWIDDFCDSVMNQITDRKMPGQIYDTDSKS